MEAPFPPFRRVRKSAPKALEMSMVEAAQPWLACIIVAVAALLVCEWRFRPGVWIAKPAASTGFVGLAVSLGAMTSFYGQLVLLALVLGWMGDVLLISSARKAFLTGLVAFLASHLAFSLAFWIAGGEAAWILGAALAVVLVGWKIGWPLVEKAPDSLRLPARAYLVVISLMVALAAGTMHRFGFLVLLGAIAFYFSDLAVARQRFVSPGFVNRLWGLPLYYFAQVLFAFSVA